MQSHAPDPYDPRYGEGGGAYDPHYGQGGAYGPGYGPPPRRGKSTIVIVLAVVGGIFLLGLATCGTLAFLAVRYGTGMVAEQVAESVADNPVIVDHIGHIESISMDMMASAGDPHPEVFVFDLEGTRGSGVLTAQSVTIDAATEDVRWGYLTLPDGERLPLFPDQPERP